jgi:hypothetical protein
MRIVVFSIERQLTSFMFSIIRPVLRIRIRLRILISTSENSKKNFDSYCFVTSLWLYILEKSKVGSGSGSKSGSFSQWYGSADTDPYQNVTDPQHCIRFDFEPCKPQRQKSCTLYTAPSICKVIMIICQVTVYSASHQCNCVQKVS